MTDDVEWDMKLYWTYARNHLTYFDITEWHWQLSVDVVVDVSVCQSEDTADDDSTSTRNVVTQDTVTEQ